MNLLLSLILLVGLVVPAWPSRASVVGQPFTSPAERRIRLAQERIALAPDQSSSHNALALALVQRARETHNPQFYEEAAKALQQSMTITPNNFAALKLRCRVLLGRHDFARALTLAKDLNRRIPDDVEVYGMLVDAHVELGNYQEAVEAAQWLLDLSPGNLTGLTRAAYLRELSGDVPGAIEFMTMALRRTPVVETEYRAWLLVQLSHLQLLSGKAALAQRLAEQALQIFPNYHYALAALARSQTDQSNLEAALETFRRHYEAAPHPENLYLVGQALAQLGRKEEARAAFAEFEAGAREEISHTDNANRSLIFYYADIADRPAEALRIARLEAARRQDAYTLDALAWALQVNGHTEEAQEQIDQALAFGIQDAQVLYHAAMIAESQFRFPLAQQFYEAILRANPHSVWAIKSRAR